MSRRKGSPSLAPTSAKPSLTDVGKCDTMCGCMKDLYKVSAIADTPPPAGKLSDSDWKTLVEQLLQLLPEDFEAAVAAVRLHRRLEGR